MSGDYSRVRFDAKNDFSGVLMQQGRVQLDADWNEWVALLDRRATRRDDGHHRQGHRAEGNAGWLSHSNRRRRADHRPRPHLR